MHHCLSVKPAHAIKINASIDPALVGVNRWVVCWNDVLPELQNMQNMQLIRVAVLHWDCHVMECHDNDLAWLCWVQQPVFARFASRNDLC